MGDNKCMETSELYTEDERAVDRLVKSAESRGGFANVMVLREGTFHVVAFWDADTPELTIPVDIAELPAAEDLPPVLEGFDQPAAPALPDEASPAPDSPSVGN